jgi:hypothetical protein
MDIIRNDSSKTNSFVSVKISIHIHITCSHREQKLKRQSRKPAHRQLLILITKNNVYFVRLRFAAVADSFCQHAQKFIIFLAISINPRYHL